MKSISLKPGKILPISEIAEKLDLDESKVVSSLRKIIREHYSRFGTQALQLSYNSLLGDVITNTSVVGLINTETFVLELAPKINNLDIGKCLGLAQLSGIKGFQLTDEQVVDVASKLDVDVSLIDYFGYSLLDSVIHISHNGLLSRSNDRVELPTKIGSEILISETINEGRGFHRPYSNDTYLDYNILPNKIIKTALNLCLENSADDVIRNLAAHTMATFKDVEVIDLDKLDGIASVGLSDYLTAPRPDYENALSHALAILEGAILGSGNGNLSIPSFTLDLDKVFEAFCSYQIVRLLNRKLYNVDVQKNYDHHMVPNVSDKKIIPDMVIRNELSKTGIILDIKNKYSSLREDGKIVISNSDIFQISYYAKTLGISECILVYPSFKPKIQYPLKASESEDAYIAKRKVKMQEILTQNSTMLFQDGSIKIIIYNIDLSGSMRNSIKSVASLCQLVADITDEKI